MVTERLSAAAAADLFPLSAHAILVRYLVWPLNIAMHLKMAKTKLLPYKCQLFEIIQANGIMANNHAIHSQSTFNLYARMKWPALTSFIAQAIRIM